MSVTAFQTVLAEVLLRPDVRSGLELRLADHNGLTTDERGRLQALALSPGLVAARQLHLAFRLTKLLSGLPKTCAVLGPDALAIEAQGFWARSAPSSFAYAKEVLGFASYLRQRLCSGLDAPGLGDTLDAEVPAVASGETT